MMHFYIVSISNPNIKKFIEVDPNVIRTVNDFKKYVASKLSKKSSQITFISEIKEPISNNAEYTPFYYKITDVSNDENLENHIQNLKARVISIYNDNNIFFSEYCQENNLKLNNNDLKLVFVGNVVKLHYGKKLKFYLSNEEKARNAYNLINKAFHGRARILIQNSRKQTIKEDYILKSDEEYVVKALYPMIFLEKNKGYQQVLHLDYLSTVNDAQMMLANECKESDVSPENFILYDDELQKITSTSKQLRHIHGVNKTFYYKIDRSKQIIEKKRKYNYDSPEIEEYQPFEIKAKMSNRRIQSVDSTKSTSKKPKSNDEPPTKNRRANSAPKKPKIKVTPIENNEPESSESESKPKKIRKKDYKPKIVNIKQDSSPSARRRARSEPKQSPKKPDPQEQKIPIKFVFDRKDDSKPYIVLRQIPIKMKISEVQELLTNDKSLNIGFEPVLKYKYKNSKFSLDQSKTIEEVLEFIKDPTVNKNIKNFIYVEPASTKKRNKIKRKLINDDDDDDKYSLVPSPKTKRIRKVIEKKDDESTNEYIYKFKFKKELARLLLFNDSRLKDNENQIKKEFEIDQNVNVNYYIVDNDGDVKPIQNLNQKMKYYQKDIIFVAIPKQKAKEMTPKSAKIKYLYQTNKNSEVKQVELEKDATVLTMKQKIAEIDNVKNLANIKIIFAGKELLDDLLLEPLKVGKTVLFVYIRFEGEILLLTAKALKNYE